MAVVAPDAMADEISGALDAAGIQHGRAAATGLDQAVTVVPVSMVKGLELDGVVVVEPAEIVAAEQQGIRALYVALTRSTQRLSVVHQNDLPAPLRDEIGCCRHWGSSRPPPPADRCLLCEDGRP